jgi:medium-chain acyl-[acyl-carrier-protein] hydrolase
MGLLLPLLRADMALDETYSYTPEEPFACRISTYGGLEDPETTRDRLSAWREHTTGTFTLRMLPGDHFFIYSHRQLVLQTVWRDLSMALGTL